MVAHRRNIADECANIWTKQSAEDETKGTTLAAAMVADTVLDDFFMFRKPHDGVVNADNAVVEVGLFTIGDIFIHVHPVFIQFIIAFFAGLAWNIRIIRVDVHDEIDEILQSGGLCC